SQSRWACKVRGLPAPGSHAELRRLAAKPPGVVARARKTQTEARTGPGTAANEPQLQDCRAVRGDHGPASPLEGTGQEALASGGKGIPAHGDAVTQQTGVSAQTAVERLSPRTNDYT